MLKFYNTLTRKKGEFKPIKKGKVGIYTCGPTVYNFVHIGNLRAYIFADILRRYLEYKGYKVKHIMNITDIDDKTIKGSKETNVTLKEFTQKYTQEFFKNLEILNIKKAFKYPKATEHMLEMERITDRLIKKGYAYEKNQSVYFDISKFKNYGKLSKIDLRGIKSGARVKVDEYEKKTPVDFVLLKKATSDEIKRGIYYKTKWGKVRPGWHLECSAMSMKYLGKTFDIHTGGIDLIFPHHENEIAQSEAYTSKKFVNWWLHNEHLLIENKKMAKSLGNVYTLRDLVKKNYPPMAIRYLLLSNHYRQKLNFTFQGLEGAKNTLEKLNEFIDRLKEYQKASKKKSRIEIKFNKFEKEFEKAMDEDLNTPKALAVIFGFIKIVNKLIDKKELSGHQVKKIYQLMKKFDGVLGILEEKKEKIPPEIKKLIDEREKARQKKNWPQADKIRKFLEKKGFQIKDTPLGPKITLGSKEVSNFQI